MLLNKIKQERKMVDEIDTKEKRWRNVKVKEKDKERV